MHSRDYIENLVIESLSKTYPTDLPDHLIELEFKALVPVFDVVIKKVLKKTHIPMFTDDDIISFMYLKAHQILRQGKWERSRSPYSYFYVAFLNLTRDIIRRQNTKKAEGMRWDILDFRTLEFDENGNLEYSSGFYVHSYEEEIELECVIQDSY